MNRRRYPQREQNGLNPDVAAVLLGGWGCQTPPGEHDPFEVFEVDLAAMWRAHRAALLVEWRRRGGQGQCWAEEQFEREG